MTDGHEPAFSGESQDIDARELLGLFDVPAFARRGQELEQALARLHARCRRERENLLEMVCLRLRQCAAVAGSDTWPASFAEPFAVICTEAGDEVAPNGQTTRSVSLRRRLAIARELIASVIRFNRRWNAFLTRLNLTPINEQIEHYNLYYVFEKECLIRSAHLAARDFVSHPRVTIEALWVEYPCLPVPKLRDPDGASNS